nr:hypothetical protein [Kibdelosporangium sp. MJ126-NF4]CEL14304.1 hypothetical protein [Kibdelosporangium sp. MJ126-NF4]CTQ88671.1 hypothetical protein [Kibdelosporangium sp. MJ126-NF4]
MHVDLRKYDAVHEIERASEGLGVKLDRSTEVSKRRSIGARTDRGTWVRIEVRSVVKAAAQGQVANGMEAAGVLNGIAKPKWYASVSWIDNIAGEAVTWRADEVELVMEAPVRSRGSLLEAPDLSADWWATFNTSLDNLMAQHTTRVATPDTEPISQELVTHAIEQAFPGQVNTTMTDLPWAPAHADLNWANVTAPECWILDWEDHGMAPRGLDSATLWVTSLAVPALAERVRAERRKDLDTRTGQLMALFHCSKILNDSSAKESPIYQPVAREAAQMVTALQGQR